MFLLNNNEIFLKHVFVLTDDEDLIGKFFGRADVVIAVN